MSLSAKFLLILTLLFIYIPTNTFSQAPDTLWTRIYGSEFSDAAVKLIKTNNEDFLLLGYTSIPPDSDYALIIKTDFESRDSK